MLGNTYAGQDCAIARALEVVGERWTLLVLRDALYGVRRFSDFAEHLDIPRAVLSDRLRKLVTNGLLVRTTADDGVPVTYELTEAGRATWPVVHALAHWGQGWAPTSPERSAPRIFSHTKCATQLDQHGHCPACGITPDAGDVMITKPDPGAPPRRTDRVSAVLAGPEPHRLLSPI
jgi:DNA-binding HxlR family transcriptional regulator